jgi:hypothetical protein
MSVNIFNRLVYINLSNRLNTSLWAIIGMCTYLLVL